MNYYKSDIVFQEIPGEISIAFYICGCPLKCKGCHSPELWTETTGRKLTLNAYQEILLKYKGYASCVLFLGGEWHANELSELLLLAHSHNYKTALYTGYEKISEKIKTNLDYLKTGPWIAERGGLNSPHTNQILMNLNTNEKLNYLFKNN